MENIDITSLAEPTPLPEEPLVPEPVVTAPVTTEAIMEPTIFQIEEASEDASSTQDAYVPMNSNPFFDKFLKRKFF